MQRELYKNLRSNFYHIVNNVTIPSYVLNFNLCAFQRNCINTFAQCAVFVYSWLCFLLIIFYVQDQVLSCLTTQGQMGELTYSRAGYRLLSNPQASELLWVVSIPGHLEGIPRLVLHGHGSHLPIWPLLIDSI